MHSEVDPAVLASLPPSMQLDLLVQVIELVKYFLVKNLFGYSDVSYWLIVLQMRERLMAENRQKYQKVKKVGIKNSSYAFQMRNMWLENIMKIKLKNIVRNKFHQNYSNRQN
jgi:DNA excision repair protein ERCC-5